MPEESNVYVEELQEILQGMRPHMFPRYYDEAICGNEPRSGYGGMFDGDGTSTDDG